MKLNFREWLLTEIGHVRLKLQTQLPLPDENGRKIWIQVAYCDPMFEAYNATGHRRDPETGEIMYYSWKQMVNMNPYPSKTGHPAGIGWEGKLPFRHETTEKELFFGCAVGEQYAMISPSRNLIRAPDDWYEHAIFTNQRGDVTYFVPGGNYGSSPSLLGIVP
jgi:hypothetical protein